MTITRQLDVRTIPPPERHPEIFRLFDALAPGDSFVLINDHAPRPLLQQLQAERAGRFEWNVLEAGPELFRIEVARRKAEGPRGVAEWLEADHRRLDDVVPEVLRLADGGSFEQSRARFAEFACGLNRHIDIEEKVLFPVFEQATGMRGGGPTHVMRIEHVEIRRRMEQIAAALRDGDAPGARAGVDAMVETLSPHNMKEEHILYPMIDQRIGGERERDALVSRCQLEV